MFQPSLVQLDHIFVRPDQVAAIQLLGDQLSLILINGQRLQLGLGDADRAKEISQKLAAGDCQWLTKDPDPLLAIVDRI